MSNKYNKISLFALALVLVASPCFAADDHALPWDNFALRVLNVIIFLGLIYKFAGAKIKTALTSRADNYVNEVKEFEAKKEEAMATLADVEKRIANIDDECKKLLEDGKNAAEKLSETLVANAQKQADAIIKQAHQSAEQIIESEVANIRAKIADEIITEVKKDLEKNLDSKKHQTLIDNSLSKVSSF